MMPASSGPDGIALSSQERHTCVLRSNATIGCWGINDTEPSLTNAVEIATGGQHDCARVGDDTVWCWGTNDSGQLGDGSMDTSMSPVQVMLP